MNLSIFCCYTYFLDSRLARATENGINELDQLIDASFRPFFNLFPHFRNLKNNQPTDGRTDGPTDKASYRDADASKKGKEKRYSIRG